ncbi:TorF family putative porin [Pseudomonadales bacterium]|nr:TorF family putative porin [Pseudomonadales bacterium]
MKSLTKAIAVASLASVSTAAMAVEGLSTTIGLVSDYNYRGVNLGDAGATVSVDYTAGGFYVGVWAINDGNGTADADVAPGTGEDGLEYDTYLGWGGEIGGVEVGIGYTRYDYTYTSNYENEINLSAGVAGFGLAVALGTAEDKENGADDDYTVIDLSYSNGAFGVLLGQVDVDDADAEWKRFELSYSAEIGGADATATYGRTFDAENITTLGGDVSSYGSDYLVLSLSKSFDL